MSTRASFCYVNGLHVYEECLTGEICIYVEDPEGRMRVYPQDTNINKKYGDLIFSKENLIEIRESLSRAIKHIEENEK